MNILTSFNRHIAIIAEYNPLHKGHLYQIQEAKKRFGKDVLCLTLMSGDFTQRGVPSVLPKEIRAECCILEGSDLVLELPPQFTLAPATLFAHGAIKTLCSTLENFYLVFGAESDNLELLKFLACFSLYIEYFDEDFEQKNLQKSGYHFAKAHSLFLIRHLKKLKEPSFFSKTQKLKKVKHWAPIHLPFQQLPSEKFYDFILFLEQYLVKHLKTLFSELHEASLNHLLLQSNNILALEYLKAIAFTDFQNHSPCFEGQIQPYLIPRKGEHYLSENEQTERFASATALRKSLQRFRDELHPEALLFLKEQCSPAFFQKLLTYQKDLLLLQSDLLPFLKFKLLELEEGETMTSPYLTQDMFQKLKKIKKAYLSENQTQLFQSWEYLLSQLRSKNISKATWNRALMCFLLNIKPNELHRLQQSDSIPLQILKHSAYGNTLIKRFKKNRIPYILGTHTKKTPLSAKLKSYRRIFLKNPISQEQSSLSFLVSK